MHNSSNIIVWDPMCCVCTKALVLESVILPIWKFIACWIVFQAADFGIGAFSLLIDMWTKPLAQDIFIFHPPAILYKEDQKKFDLD